MNWIILAGIGIVAIAVAVLYQKKAMSEEGSDPITGAIVFQFLLALCTGIYAMSVGFEWPALSLWPFFAFSTVLYAYGTLMFFWSIKLIDASEMSIIGASGVLVTILAAYFFLGERLTQRQLIGVLMVLSSIVILEYRKDKFKLSKGALLAIAGTSMYGLAVTSDVYIIRNYSAISYVPLASLLPGLLLSFMYPRKLGLVVRSLGKISRNLIVYSILYSVQAIAYYVSLENGAGPGQLSTMFKIQVVLTVVLAMVFLKERDNWQRKVVAAIVGTIGVMLVA